MSTIDFESIDFFVNFHNLLEFMENSFFKYKLWILSRLSHVIFLPINTTSFGDYKSDVKN